MTTDIQNKLAAMSAGYLAKLPDKIQELEQAAASIWENAGKNPDAVADGLAVVQALSHKLAGSSGTYGFQNIGHSARNLELACQALLESSDDDIAKELDQIRALMMLIGEQVKTGSDPALNKLESNFDFPDAVVDPIGNGKSNKLVLVDDDPEQSRFLQQLLTNFGYSVRLLTHPSLLKSMLQEEQPDAVIMDIMFPDARDGGLDTINALREEKILNCPVNFISVREDFSARLKSIRGGSDGYIVKPININEIVEMLGRLISESERPPFRVLVVDDDEEMTGFCKVVMEEAGLVTSVVNNPLEATEEMINFNPDVIVLDIEMPECSGFELAAVIRQMGDAFLQIPILFLTAHDENTNQMQAARAGSEDFITKPVDPERLLTSVIARSERSRILKSLYQRLRSGEERFGSITRSANEAVISANSKGLVLSWNPSAEKIFGYRKREILGKQLTMLIPGEYREAHVAGFNRVAEGGKSKIVGKTVGLTGLKKDGTEFPMDLSLTSWKSEGEIYFAATMRDITERKETEAALKRAKEQADKANKAKSDFLSSMSHELRTPLNAILGFSQMLQFNPKEPLTEIQTKSVDLIMKGGEHLLELINDILDLAKIESGKIDLSIENIKIMTIIEECVVLVSDMADRKNISIDVIGAEGDIPLIMADFTRIKQVLLNFLSNAIKYNRDDGKVTISIGNPGNGLLRVSIVDTGYGISESLIGDLFQPFNRLGAETSGIEGTGIGLVVCKQLIESMQGRLGVESEKNTGSTFWFEMPCSSVFEDMLSSTITAETEQQKDVATGIPEKQAVILYVEDNPSNLRLMEMIVSRVEGLSLISSHTAELGIEMARSQRPDLIVLDINLPGMDGFEALENLKKYDETKNIPVMALSAAATKRDIEKGNAAGFARYLTKPMQVPEVLGVFNELLADTGSD